MSWLCPQLRLVFLTQFHLDTPSQTGLDTCIMGNFRSCELNHTDSYTCQIPRNKNKRSLQVDSEKSETLYGEQTNPKSHTGGLGSGGKKHLPSFGESLCCLH